MTLTVTLGQSVLFVVVVLVVGIGVGIGAGIAASARLFQSFARERTKQRTERTADWRRRAGSTGE